VKGEGKDVEDKKADPAAVEGDDILMPKGPACPCPWACCGEFKLPSPPTPNIATPVDCGNSILCRNGFDPVGWG